MSDFRKQVRDHYDAQSLPPETVEAVLARGRAAAVGEDMPVKRTPWGRYLALIAAVAVFSFLGFWWQVKDANAVSYNELAPRVIAFFGSKPELVPAPPTKQQVRDWLLSKGAPPEFEMPAALAGLENAACQVVDVRGRKAYLSCYWREQKPDRGDHELIHLLVARADDFRDQPKSSEPVIRELDGWSFASWKKGDVAYTLATAAPPEKLTPFLSATDRLDPRRLISMVEFRGALASAGAGER
jgi:hypothetical protein